MSRIIDLTHTLFDGLEAFPGNLNVSYKPMHEVKNGGYRVGELHVDGHTGTHLDVPRHVFPEGRTLDKLDLNKCIGPSLKVSLLKDEGDEISIEDLKPYEDKIKKLRRLVLVTGWSKKFGTSDFYENYPGISANAASWLVGLGVDLIGIEQPSVHFSNGLEVHHIFLEGEVVVVEALAWPEKIPKDEFEIICLPLSIRDGDGSPTRVVALA